MVFNSSAMEEIGSRPGPGDSDPVWDPDYLPEFSWGTPLLNQWAFYHQRWNPCWPGPSFFRFVRSGLPD